MAKRSRRTFSTEFKTKVVLEANTEYETIQAIAQRFEVHPNQIVARKKEFWKMLPILKMERMP